MPWPPGRRRSELPLGSLSLLMESEARLYDFDLTRFLHANRYPSSGQARGHASLENALAIQQLERGLVHARVAGGDDTAAALRGLALPCGDHATRSADDR